MNIESYLERIGLEGPFRPDLDSLRALHRRHSQAIPYENVDVQLGRRVDLDTVRIVDKMVTRRRGGWCFEMNGLFHWALSELGFEVTRMVGGVPGAQNASIDPMGNHLVLRVELDEPWLVDVGLGAAMLEPIPLRVGSHEVAGRTFDLAETGDGWWRFKNHEGRNPPLFDFQTHSDEALLESVCQQLQDDDQSLFRQNLICCRFDDAGTDSIRLLGRVIYRPGEEPRTLANSSELVAVLEEDFCIYDSELPKLWPAVEQRHREIFGP